MAQTRQDREREVSWKFRRADRALKRRIEQRVKDTGVYRSQHRLLMHLNLNPRSSQAALAEHLEVTPAAIAVSIKKLEKGGYICRETDACDNRYQQVTISEKGQQVIEKSVLIFQQTEREMFAGFSDGEMEQLEEFLDRIARNLELPGKERIES